MLLHSREGYGEHRPADINSLLDESLNLAYHGARAEKTRSFQCHFAANFYASSGTIELFREITRLFLLLISNDFMRDQAQDGDRIQVSSNPHCDYQCSRRRRMIRIRDKVRYPGQVKQKMCQSVLYD